MVVQFGGPTCGARPMSRSVRRRWPRPPSRRCGDRSACLLANHGMILFARDPEQALIRALSLEQLCRQYLMARAAGKPKLLTEQQIEATKERFKTYGPRPS